MNYVVKKLLETLMLGICLFGSRKNINHQIKFTFSIPSIYLIYLNHFFVLEIKHVIWENVRSGKCPFGELSVRGTVLRETVGRGNVFGKLSVEENSFGERTVGEMSVEKLSGYPTRQHHDGRNSTPILYVTKKISIV